MLNMPKVQDVMPSTKKRIIKANIVMWGYFFGGTVI
jgi:hypothetical protein